MKRNIGLILILQILFVFYSICQQDSALTLAYIESTPDTTKFRMHIDSLRKYAYQDHDKLKWHIDKCHKILANDPHITKNDILNFAIRKIDFELYDFHYTKAYELIKKYNYIIKDDEVSIHLKNDFLYIEGFVLMNLGDSEFAQKAFYKLLDHGEEAKDTFICVQALYSLAQLFLGEEDYENSEKYFLKTNKLEVPYLKIRNRTDYTQTYYGLANLYYLKKDYEKSNYYTDLGLETLQDYEKGLRIAFLINKGRVAIKNNTILSAQKAYDSAFEIAQKIGSEGDILQCKAFQAELFNAQDKLKEALNIYEEFISEAEDKQFFQTLEWLTKAHEISGKIGNHEKAYEYVLKANTIQDSINNEKKMQQTTFLKIKYDSEKKNKENQILASQVAQKQSQNLFLYSLVFIFLLLLIVVFGAYFQKQKYNKLLEQKVENRTKDLEHANIMLTSTNVELDQFNKILSHDLKEPLRSIVGFSTIAKKKLPSDSNIVEYLNIIEKSGKQLNQLIEDVSTFHKVGNDSNHVLEVTNTNSMMGTILESVSILLAEKNAQVKFKNLPSIRTHRLFLYLVFKNLIENGLKYNESDKPQIEVSYFLKNNTHFFEFKDNGIGISSQFHETVFGMFKRLNDRGSYSGSGLGLSLSKKMIKKLEGDILIIHSKKGEGSTFQISLPVLDSNEEVINIPMSISESN